MLEFLLSLPLLMAYLLGSVLTLLLAARYRTVSSALGFLGFFLLLAVRLSLPTLDLFALRLQGRGMPLPRVNVVTILADLTMNLTSAVGVLCIVGAIALAARDERRL
jgi:hypothetical protein